MPCVSGRSLHILCKPDCLGEDPCSCRVREAYSCRPVCCRDGDDNTQLTLEDARDMLCDYLTGDMGVISAPYANVGEIRTDVCTDDLPYFNCPLEITVEGSDGVTGTVGPYTVAVVDKGTCSGTNTNALENGANSNYIVSVDGIQCGSFINVNGP